MPNKNGQMCVAFGCSNRVGDFGLSFHQFPDDAIRKAQWINAVKRKDFVPSKYSKLCSKHFSEDDFISPSESFLKTKFKRRLLKLEAVPSQHLSYSVSKETSKKPRITNNSNKPVLDKFILESPATDFEINMQDDPSLSSCKETQTTTDNYEHKYNTLFKKYKNLKQRYQRILKKCNSLSQIKRRESYFIGRLKKKTIAIKRLQSKNRRLQLKLQKLNDIINELKRKNLLDKESLIDLKLYYDDEKIKIIRELFSKKKTKYSEYIKNFSSNLFYHSSKAYNYLRKYFNLPHPSTLRRWFSKIGCDPGFTVESFEELRRRHSDSAENYTYCSLVMDEISIKKHVEWNHNTGRFSGLVDYGDGRKPEDTEATSALTLMCVGLKSYWKLPIGYFLVNGVKGEYLSSLIKEAISKLYSLCGVIVASVTCDGASHNINCFHQLGASFDISNPRPYFAHPNLSKFYVSCILDPPHMLKLIRNSWAALKSIVWPNVGEARWEYVVKLNEFQTKHSLRLANKLSEKHINFHNNKMKVNLASQLFSKSVAEALRTLHHDSEISDFKSPDVLATAEFIQFVNDLFDIFNCKRLSSSSGLKIAITLTNEHKWRPFLERSASILSSLQDVRGNKIIESIKKTGFMGFFCNTSALFNLADNLLFSSESDFQFLLTYKLSQDFIEIFFNAIRSRNGWNINPTAQQFKNSYRQLLVHGSQDILLSTKSNATIQDETALISLTILSTESDQGKRLTNSKLLRSNEIFSTSSCSCANVKYCSLCKYAVYYIGGFVVRRVMQKIDCVKCSSALILQEPLLISDIPFNLTVRKNFSNSKCHLYFPSIDAFNLFVIVESEIRRITTLHSTCLNTLKSKILHNCTDIFTNLDLHSFNQSVGIENHRNHLILLLTDLYCKIRLNKLADDVHLNENNRRNVLHRSIIFKNL